MCAAKNGFAVIDDVEGKPTLNYLARPLDHDPERSRAQRFNDGACDAKGRFFAGTLSMSSNSPYIGQLWCYDPSIGQAKLIDDDVLVSCISPYMRLWWLKRLCRKVMVWAGAQTTKLCQYWLSPPLDSVHSYKPDCIVSSQTHFGEPYLRMTTTWKQGRHRIGGCISTHRLLVKRHLRHRMVFALIRKEESGARGEEFGLTLKDHLTWMVKIAGLGVA